MCPGILIVEDVAVKSSIVQRRISGKTSSYSDHDAPVLKASTSSDNTMATESCTTPLEAIPIVYSKQEGATEPTTGIRFPAELNGYKFIGCGVRTKYLIIHAYAVGLYLDTTNVKPGDDIESLLMDPNHPRILRLVMNRDVTSRQYMGSILEALTPLMRGQDLDRLDDMENHDMPKMLKRGTEIFLMIRADKLILQCGHQSGEIPSIVLTRAICENYFGKRTVSPAAKRACWEALEKLTSGQ